MTPCEQLKQFVCGMRREIGWDACILAAVLLPAIVIYAGMAGAPVSTLWDAISYFIAAQKITGEFPFLPTGGFRAPGYPLFLYLLQGGQGEELTAVANAQKVLFLVTIVLVYAIARQITASRFFSAAAALLYTLNSAALLFANSIMTETLATFLATFAALAFVAALSSPRRSLWFTAGCVALLLAVFVRPTFLFAVPVVAACLGLLGLRNRSAAGLRQTAAALAALGLIVVGPVVAYAASNYYRTGHFKAFSGGGFSSLNYVTNPCFYYRLSDKLSYIREPLLAYQRAHYPEIDEGEILADERCRAWFWPPRRGNRFQWGEVFEHVLLPAHREKFQDHKHWDTVALHITRQAAWDQPVEYLRIFSQALTEFWMAFGQGNGLYETVDDLIARRTVVDGRIVEPVLAALGSWNRWLFRYSFPFVLGAMILAAFWPRNLRPEQRIALLALAAFAVIYSLLSVAFEPGGYQARYRIPLEPIIVVCAVFLLQRMAHFFDQPKGELAKHNSPISSRSK